MRARSAARHPGHGCDSAISYDDGSPRYPRVALPRSIEIIVSMYNINYAMSPRCAWDRAAKQRKTAAVAAVFPGSSAGARGFLRYTTLRSLKFPGKQRNPSANYPDRPQFVDRSI